MNIRQILIAVFATVALTCCGALGSNPFMADVNVNIDPGSGNGNNAAVGNAVVGNTIEVNVQSSLCNSNSPFPVCMGFETSVAGQKPNYPVNPVNDTNQVALLMLSNHANVPAPTMTIDSNVAFRGNHSLRISFVQESTKNTNDTSVAINSMGMLQIPYALVNPNRMLDGNNVYYALYGRMFVKTSNSFATHPNATLLNEDQIYAYVNLHTDLPTSTSPVKVRQLRFGATYNANLQTNVIDRFLSVNANGTDQPNLLPDPNSLINPAVTVTQSGNEAGWSLSNNANLQPPMLGEWTCVEWVMTTGTNSEVGPSYTYQFYINGEELGLISNVTDPPNVKIPALTDGNALIPVHVWVGLNNQTMVGAPSLANEALVNTEVWVDEIALSANERIGCSN